MNCAQEDKNWFLESLKNKDLVNKLKKIKLIITDIDGALTDGQLYLFETNKTQLSLVHTTGKSKNFSVQDGFAIDQAIKKNHLKVAFLSGRNDETTNIRAKMLGISKEMCFTGICENKIDKVKIIQNKAQATKEETLYFGDDFLDLETKDASNLFSCPQNAPFYIQSEADTIVPRVAGNHVFRLLLDLVLYVQEKHFAQEFINKALK